jgi:hypothetical protein
MSGWINVLALVETQDVPTFDTMLARHVSGLDATHWSEDFLLVDLPTIEDEVLFRLAHMNDTTIREMCSLGEHRYFIPPRHTADAQGWIADGLFDGLALPVTAVWMELRDSRILSILHGALSVARHSFAGAAPRLWVIS